EAFFEHGEIGHNTLPYDEVVRVPLVVFGAGVAPNRRVATPVSHGDYMATILELMSLPTPGVPGRSFAAHIRDDAVTRDDSERSIVSAGWDLPLSAQRPAYAIRRGGKKLLRFRTADGVAHAPLFDLDADPGETR